MIELSELDSSSAVYEQAAERFSLLSSVPRLRILRALCGRELCVSELMEVVGLPQPGISQQLTVLHRSGLLARRKQGSQVYYRAHPETGAFFCGAIQSLLCEQPAERLLEIKGE